MLHKALGAALLAFSSLAWSAPSFVSAHALVMDEATGEVLYEKDAGTAAPIASMTKLLTAMVVLDAQLNPYEIFSIDPEDLDRLKGTTSGVPVGALFTRRSLLDLALMSSDNRAAHAVARTYPGGMPAFLAAMDRKIAALGLEGTRIVEPTGLSPSNRATARDMAKIVKAAAAYPEIVRATSQSNAVILVNGQPRTFRNTNGLVGAPGWDVTVSKTGFIREAGRCVTMQMQAAGRKVLVVLMGAGDSAQRSVDAFNVRSLLTGEAPPVLARAKPAARTLRVAALKGPSPLKAKGRAATKSTSRKTVVLAGRKTGGKRV